MTTFHNLAPKHVLLPVRMFTWKDDKMVRQMLFRVEDIVRAVPTEDDSGTTLIVKDADHRHLAYTTTRTVEGLAYILEAVK